MLCDKALPALLCDFEHFAADMLRQPPHGPFCGLGHLHGAVALLTSCRIPRSVSLLPIPQILPFVSDALVALDMSAADLL